MIRRPPRSTLFPSTPLSRSPGKHRRETQPAARGTLSPGTIQYSRGPHMPDYTAEHARAGIQTKLRSEEHTSELQSRLHLVCRLLLEKKKNRVIPEIPPHHTR